MYLVITILPSCHHFQLREIFPLWKYPSSSTLKKYVYLLEKYLVWYKQESLTHCFTMRSTVACERSTPYLSAFSSGKDIYLTWNSPDQLNWSNVYLGENTIYVRSNSVLIMISLWEFNQHVTEILPISQHFQVAESFTSWKGTLLSWIGETHVSPGSIWSTLQSWVPYPLFCYENWVTMWRNSPYLSWFSLIETITSWKISIFTRFRETRVYIGRIPPVRSGSVLHMFSQWELRDSVDRILHSSQHFQVWEICPLLKIALFSWIAEIYIYISFKNTIYIKSRCALHIVSL
jgi:hypothetical protein